MTTTLSQPLIKIDRKDLRGGVVILPLREYRAMQERTAPTYYLTGKKARDLDTLVKEGLKEHHEGKTIKAGSLKEALKIYEGRRRR